MLRILAPVGLVVGLISLFLGQQLPDDNIVGVGLTWLGVLAVVGVTGWRMFERSKAKDAAKPVEMALFAARAGVIFAMMLYALSGESGLEMVGADADGKFAVIVAVLWPAIMLVSFGALLFMELAYFTMPVAESVEIRRVQSAAHDGLSIGLSLVFVVCLNFAAAQRNVRKDLSYFKTTRPSEATMQMVERLGEPIKVVLFYPDVSDVLQQLKPYFEEVEGASDQLTVEIVDHALAPALVRQHRVQRNGFIVFLKGEDEESQQAESFEVGEDLEAARSRLRTLDGRFQRIFMKLTTRRRELHITVGHDEYSASGIEGDSRGDRVQELRDALERSNITTRNLGISQGLANEVPEDAPAVAVIGPRKPMLREEAQSLLNYVRDGGRLIVFVDPDADHGLDPLLHGLGVQLEEGVLTSDRDFIRRRYNESDRAIVRSNGYTSHPTVTIASRNRAQLATVFIRGGAVSRYEGDDVLEGASVVFPLRSNAQFWLDKNDNYTHDDDEPLAAHNMIAAISVPSRDDAEGEDEEGEDEEDNEGRAVVVADGQFITDQIVGNPGNQLVFADILQWMLGEEQIVGDVTSEEDIPIEHSREGEAYWFWGSSFTAPILLFGAGLWVALRRQRRRRDPKPAKGGGGAKARTREEEDSEAESDEQSADEESQEESEESEAASEDDASDEDDEDRGDDDSSDDDGSSEDDDNEEEEEDEDAQ